MPLCSETSSSELRRKPSFDGCRRVASADTGSERGRRTRPSAFTPSAGLPRVDRPAPSPTAAITPSSCSTDPQDVGRPRVRRQEPNVIAAGDAAHTCPRLLMVRAGGLSLSRRWRKRWNGALDPALGGLLVHAPGACRARSHDGHHDGRRHEQDGGRQDGVADATDEGLSRLLHEAFALLTHRGHDG